MISEGLTNLECSDIAIIGLAGRFPHAKNIDEFWENLSAGIDSITYFSEQELKNSGVSETLINNPNYVKAGMLLEDIGMFDAPFFGFSPREAQLMDPQHRLLLEVCWEALENAGYDSERSSARIGVFTGVDLSRYLINNICPRRDFIDSLHLTDTVSLSNNGDFLPTQISYKLNLKGPSLNVQTACSTSLVTVHLACQSLLNYESDMALAGGVAITLLEKEGYLYQEAGIFSSDGHCRAFDARANGTVAGSGAAIIVLKRFSDALSDNDTIYGVIKASAVNNDGAAKAGFTAPSVEGQSKVIIEALTVADTPAETISYIETHGTATALGDLVEIAALTKAFQASTDKKGFCAIGSVKSNMGHLNSAAGIAGLVKTVLSLKHKQIPPSLYFETTNPKIDFANSPFYVNNKLTEWKSNGIARRAGVSSFGFGGTNAHVILEETNVAPSITPQQDWKVIVLSAKTATALDIATSNLANHLQQNPSVNLTDVAYTAQIGRRGFAYRRLLVCQNLTDAIENLATLDPKRVFSAIAENYSKSIVFMFPGQGTQYINMGRDIYRQEPVFQKHLDECLELFQPLLGVTLHNILYPSPDEIEAASQEINQTHITQPLIFAIEYALAKLWLAWGIVPQAMIGHSIGEYVAACLSGVFSLSDAVKLVANRGQLMQKLALGAMVSVKLPENEIRDLLGEELSLAAVNSPSDTVVSGTKPAIESFIDRLGQVTYQRLHTSHAFHSKMMDPILSEFAEVVKSITLNVPETPFLSNLTGTWITNDQIIDPSYWVNHLRSTVRFSDGLKELLKVDNSILIEVGPSLSLSSLAKAHNIQNHLITASLPHPKEKASDLSFILNSLGRLWLNGVNIEWSALYQSKKPKRIALPTYPFERQRYWFERQERQEQQEQVSKITESLTKQPDIGNWFYTPSWRRTNKLLLTNPSLSEQKNWLIFVDNVGLGEEIAKQLEASNQIVSKIILGQQFEKLSENSYTLNLQRAGDYQSLIQDLVSLNRLPKKVVNLWSVSSNPQVDNTLELSQNATFYSLLLLVQAFSKENVSHNIEIFTVSNNLQEVIGTEKIQPEKATLLGVTTVIPQEHSNIDCFSIDLLLSDTGFKNKQIVNNLINDFINPKKETFIAYREGYRWIRAFEPIYFAPTKQDSLLKLNGVYLITGGLGDISLALAEHLAETVKAKLVLLGRSSFPSRTEWKSWLLNYGEEHHISQKILNLRKIEDLGGEILIINAMLSDETEARIAFTQVLERFGKINGIFHNAGIAGGGLISLKTLKAVEEVFLPKIQVLTIISNIVKDMSLDFFVLCSSATALTGGLGQVDYCAANAFLDAFSYYFNQRGILTVSINWDAWKEVGMAVKSPLPDYLSELRQEHLRNAILTSEGIEVFSRILSNPMPQVIVSTQQFQASMTKVKTDALEILGKLHSQTSTFQNRPNLSSTYVAPSNWVEETLVKIWQGLLGIEQIGIYDNFLELGGNSLLGVQVIGQISENFQIDVPMYELFESLTISELAQAVLAKIAELTDDEALEDILSDFTE